MEAATTDAMGFLAATATFFSCCCSLQVYSLMSHLLGGFVQLNPNDIKPVSVIEGCVANVNNVHLVKKH